MIKLFSIRQKFEWLVGPYRPLSKYWFILIFGRPGNCKSLEQARITYWLFNEYHYTEKQYPDLQKRFVFTNQKLEKDLSAQEEAHGHLHYWEKPDDFRYCPRGIECWKGPKYGGDEPHMLHDCDLLIDELGTIFPADGYADTPLWIRKMWAQHRKNGLRIVGLTQDYKNCDINARRMLWKAYHLRKRIGSRDITPTLPPLVKWTIKNFINPKKRTIWGIYTKQEINPEVLEQDKDATINIQLEKQETKDLEEIRYIGAPVPHLITYNKTHLFDTTQNVKEFKLQREVEHLEAICKVCKKVHEGHKWK